MLYTFHVNYMYMYIRHYTDTVMYIQTCTCNVRTCMYTHELYVHVIKNRGIHTCTLYIYIYIYTITHKWICLQYNML